MKPWTREYPTKANHGQWFICRNVNRNESKFVEIRYEDDTDRIYLSAPCNSGLEKASYGVRLDSYPPNVLEFWGPVEMPTDFLRK